MLLFSFKKTLFTLLFLPMVCLGQDYVDLFKIKYGQTLGNDFENSPESTNIKSFEADLTIPIVLNDTHVLLTGANFSVTNLQLYPLNFEVLYLNVDQNNAASLYSTIFKIGLASTYNEKWSSTLVLLPKIASDYIKVKKEDFYIGGVALLKYQKNEHLKYRFGIYASTEAFGLFATPIIGWYYLSPSKKFEMDMSLPISADLNYTQNRLTYGIDYYGIGRSFRLYGQQEDTLTYVDVSSLEFATYVQYNLLKKSVLLRAKFGYSSSNYEIYGVDDKIDLGLSAFSFGDNRNQRNTTISGGLFFRFEAIYRFNILPKK